MKKENYWPFLAFMLVLCLVFSNEMHAQEKKTIRPEDYSLWKTSPKIVAAETSEDGNWYAYQTGNNSLVNICLKNTNSESAYRFVAKTNPNKNRSSLDIKLNFSQTSKHFAFISNDTLNLVELNSGKVRSFKGFKDFRFVGEGNYLFAEGDLILNKSIWLMDLKNLNNVTIDHVEQFSIDPTHSTIAVSVVNGKLNQVKTILLKPGFPVSLIAANEGNLFSKLTWNKMGTALAFVETKGVKNGDTVIKIHACTHFGSKSILKTLLPGVDRNLPEPYLIDNDEQLYLSADGKKLFFYLIKNDSVEPKGQINSKVGIEVSLPADPVLSADFRRKKEDRQLWYQWNFDSNKLMAVTDTIYNCATPLKDDKHALIYHKRGYLPRHNYVNSFMDIYIKDLETGSSKLLLKKVWDYPNQVSLSPDGKYIAYYKAKHWWLYDVYQDTHRCLTEGFTTAIENVDLVKTATIPPYGSPGWLQKDGGLIIYDKNDVWLLSVDGKKRLKMTDGAETNQTFRISKRTNVHEPFIGPGTECFELSVFNGTEGILIKSVNNENLDNGLFLWTQASGLNKLLSKPMEFKCFDKVTYKKPFLFTESNFSTPPRLMLFNPKGNTELCYQTDPHQKDFKWGRSELVHFTTPDGKRLKGALSYPAEYVKGKRYPMIVNIYEKKSHYLHDYQMPSLSQGDAHNDVNITNYNAEGYLVFLPDIASEINDPGISATKCVVAAVEKVIEMGVVDRENIGLMGHSFGGYETAFIATQTSLFKTAIASAGITDISSWSLLNSQFGVNFIRVEEDQFRMAGTFMGADYTRNSPMHYIHQMKTPILLWSGDKDTNVDVSQTKSFHNALWRLGKQSTMLIYKGENHSLIKPDNQIDLARRLKNWFDHYLKGEKPAEWMVRKMESSK